VAAFGQRVAAEVRRSIKAAHVISTKAEINEGQDQRKARINKKPRSTKSLETILLPLARHLAAPINAGLRDAMDTR
jgi:hypothetical protein